MEQSLEELARPILEEQGMELVDLEVSRKGDRLWVRMFIDRVERVEGGVTAEELGYFNREFGRVLEVEEIIPESYLLEVSSPGVNRRIRKLKDFMAFLGEMVTVTAKDRISGRKRFHGRLAGADEKGVTLEDEGRVFTVPHESIARATLDYDFSGKGSKQSKNKRRSRG